MANDLYVPSEKTVAASLINDEKYREMYKRSVESPEEFWRDQAQNLEWIKPFTKVKNVSFSAPDVTIKWFEDGIINASVNCIDRHLPNKVNDTAIIWESDNPLIDKKISYGELHHNVCKLSNIYKSLGVSKGDRVTS
jgi:acetyl-CoA synthetase